MNGTPILLKVQTPEPILRTFHSSDWGAFYDFIQSSLFMDMWYEFDQRIGVRNYCRWSDEQQAMAPVDGTVVREERDVKFRPISILGFLDHLYWMVMNSFSYHDTRDLTEEEGKSLIYRFVEPVLGLNTTLFEQPKSWIGLPGWISQEWTFYSLSPNFLKSTGYFQGVEDPPWPAYFDGGNSDSAIYFYRDNIFYLLLTSGSP
jgi:hypothetical protein